VNFVALEFYADAVGPREQVKNVGGVLEIEKKQRLVAGDMPTTQNASAESGDARVIGCVNQFRYHG